MTLVSMYKNESGTQDWDKKLIDEIALAIMQSFRLYEPESIKLGISGKNSINASVVGFSWFDAGNAASLVRLLGQLKILCKWEVRVNECPEKIRIVLSMHRKRDA